MNEEFHLTFHRLAEDSRFAGLAKALAGHAEIASSVDFNRFCQDACRYWSELLGETTGKATSQFAELSRKISGRQENTIATSWGGVVITLHEHPRVEKYLVVQRGSYLSLEKHEQKDENLEVVSGAGLLLYRESFDGFLAVEVLAEGMHFHLPPGVEHCVIGTENLLVFERSIDPKGMDKDLIFIYEPDNRR